MFLKEISRYFKIVMRVLSVLFLSILLFVVGIIISIGVMYYQYSYDLPDYHQLTNYEAPVASRIYANNGRLLAEYALEHRVFVPLSFMPQLVVASFIAAEDKSFYQHSGLDFIGILRAFFTNLKNYRTDHKPMGASTITQQVAKNFLMTNTKEISFKRKIKEAILAFRIEKALSKDRILELYLNEIYLGFGSYGVAAASISYFNKSLNELTVAEAAFLAALPKAPNNYHPLRNLEAARGRRDWVINRMANDGYISSLEATVAIRTPLVVRDRTTVEFIRDSDHFSEDVRRLLLEHYGEYVLYRGGLHVRTTLSPELQKTANQILRDGLIRYDRRHGWRGAINHIFRKTVREPTVETQRPLGLLPEWNLATVLNVNKKSAVIKLSNGNNGTIPLSELTWARFRKSNQMLGPLIRTVNDVLSVGDVIAVESLKTLNSKEIYTLRQIPEVDGALVALDPHTGRVLAMVGGFSYERSEFNRATQALRQPGSAFKPFVYLTALNQGYTPSSIIIDAPFIVDQGPSLPKWKPQNYDGSYLGPTTLRVGVEKSRNAMAVRLAQEISMTAISRCAKQFGIVDYMPLGLAMALGASETTVLRLTGAYAMLANGGKQIFPTLIDRIQTRTGHTIYRHDDRLCLHCLEQTWNKQAMPLIADIRSQVIDSLTAYQMVSILRGVVQHGTGSVVAELDKPLAGKTGTSNDSMDAWFVGFSPDLAVGVFIGFDEPHTLGPKETGASIAAPIFRNFMQKALAECLTDNFPIPTKILLVRVSQKSGLPANLEENDFSSVITEAFKPGDIEMLTERETGIKNNYFSLPILSFFPQTNDKITVE